MKKVILSAALLMGFATISFAGTPKGETKEATPAKSEAKSESGGTTYWVTSETTLNGQPAYNIDQSPRNCDGDERPCQITTTSGTLSSPVLKSTVENSALVHIDSFQD